MHLHRRVAVAAILAVFIAMAVVGWASAEGPEPTPVDPAAQEAIRRASTLSGISEVVPGFGGIFLDRNDNSIVYVYMLDPTQRELAEEAARVILGAQRFSQEIREVRILQAQYSIGQLNEWYARMWDFVPQGRTGSDLNEGKNRLWYGVLDEKTKIAFENELARRGIPREAVIIEKSGPVVLMVGDPEEEARVRRQKWMAVGLLVAGLLVAGAVAGLTRRHWSRREDPRLD